MNNFRTVEKNNFDLLRLLLALTVFIVHTATLTNIPLFHVLADFLNSEYAVYSFFTVSGFLIFMSYENQKDLNVFFKKRFLRIFPGYSVAIIFVAFSAVFISSNSFSDYFSYEWLKYLLFNILTLNFIQPTLPGVFNQNIIHSVNGALWTIKIEVMFYLTVPIIGVLIKKFRKIIIFLIIYIASMIYYESFMYLGELKDKNIYFLLAKQLPGQMSFFIMGAMIYYYFDNFKKYSHVYLIISAFLYLVYYEYDIRFVLPISLGILVIYFATIFKFIGNFGKYGDFSFGIYIWHFPIIQVFLHFNLFSYSPILAFVFLIATVLSFSIISWKFIEKPFLSKKSHYIMTEKDTGD